MMENQVVFTLLEKLKMDAPEAKTLPSTHLDDSRLHISPEEDTYLMIQAPDVFVNNSHKHASFHANSFSGFTWALLKELSVCYFEHDQEKFSTFTLFVDSNIQQTKIIFASTY